MITTSIRLTEVLVNELDRLKALGHGAASAFVRSAIAEKLARERLEINEAIEDALKEKIEVERQRQEGDTDA